jgi:hypothetical protein
MNKHEEKRGETRRELLETLGEIITTGLHKYSMITVKNKDRQGWGRLIVSAISEAGKLLKDSEIADLVDRVESLEAILK